MSIFHITVATLVGAMTVAGVAIAMAPSRDGEVAKTAPAAAPMVAAIPVPPQPAPATSSNPLLDGCVISAIGRLPKADGLRVTKSGYEHWSGGDIWKVNVSVELHGREAHYQWVCLLIGNGTAQLRNMP